jgi:hypothetical protein
MPWAPRSSTIPTSVVDHATATQPDVRETPDGTPSSTEPAASSRGRRIIVDGLIVLASILGVVAILAVWANRLLFNPDNWSNTSTQLLQSPAVRNATSNYLVDQLYANVNVAGLLKAGLPPRLDPLAGPAAGALRNLAVQGVDLALTRPRIQSAWAAANRAAAQSFVTIVNGGKGAVGVQSGAVTLNLGQIADDVAARLGLPSSVSSKIPPSAAHLTVFRSKQIKLVQDLGNAVRSLALLLTILVPCLYALALLLARGRRRRTLLSIGVAIALVGMVGLAGRALLESRIPDSLMSDVSLRPAGRAVVTIATQIMGDISVGFIVVGAVAIVAAWFAGPARPAWLSRRWIAPFLRDHAAWTFAIVAFVMLLIFIWQPIHAAGTPAGIIAFSVLALVGTEALRRQTAREFPAPAGGQPA